MPFDHAWLQGVFDRLLPEAGMPIRAEQLAMANYVQAALVQNRPLLAEAGVGTGKTYAYLIPAFGHHPPLPGPGAREPASLPRAGGPRGDPLLLAAMTCQASPVMAC